MVNEKDILITVYYRQMWTEFSSVDTLSEDYIIHLIGTKGLNTLINECLFESCEVVDGRTLYKLDKRYFSDIIANDSEGVRDRIRKRMEENK